jgi:hypothetical protein
MNWLGWSIPQRGCGHRTSASTPTISSLPSTTMGWYTRVNVEVLIASSIAASSSRRLATRCRLVSGG